MTSPPKNQASLLTPRKVAVEALSRVLDGGRELDAALQQHAEWKTLAHRDQAFARRLALTTLRHYGVIRYLISERMERPLKGKKKPLFTLLAAGVAQLLFMDIPAHAAVNTSVELAKKTGFHPFAGLVNALLKKIAAQKDALLADSALLTHNTPGWLWDRWCKTYGTATALAIAQTHDQEPPLDFSVASQEPEARSHWAKALGGTALPTGSIRATPTGAISELPGYAEGAWWVQDAAAALPVQLLRGQQTILDLCAAPGGKTVQLLSMDAHVIAVDQSAQRLERMKENMCRLQLEAEIVCADALDYTPPAPVDAILLDAPCSATGTLRRHPEIAWSRTEGDIARLVKRQRRLLNHAATLLAPGGMLVYAVCSLEPEEGEEQITRFLADHPAFERRRVEAEEIGGQAEFITSEGDLRTLPCHWPDRGGLDGFYAARLVKT